MSEEDEVMMHKVETRLAKNKKDFEIGKRPDILQQINIDRILNDEKSMTGQVPASAVVAVPQSVSKEFTINCDLEGPSQAK